MSLDLLSSLAGNIGSILLIVIFFGGSIFIHELGHFIAARRRGVKVDRFSIGFGPALWRHRGKDGVEYRVSCLPLGGYVALPQLADLSAIEGGSDGDISALPPISYATKMIVFVAGAFCNLLLAFVLACALWAVGRPELEYLTTTRIGYISPTLKLMDGREVPSPALAAGLKPNDVIRKVDGREVHDWIQFKNAMVLGTKTSADGDRVAALTVERAGKMLEFSVHPQRSGDEGFRTIGVSPAFAPIVDSIRAGSPSEKLGFKPGDRLAAFDGTEVISLEQVTEYLHAHRAQPIVLSVMRAGHPVAITVPSSGSDQSHPLTGLAITANYELLRETPWRQFSEIVGTTFQTLWSLISPHGDLSLANLSGPIGIGRGFWDAANSDYPIRFVLWFAVLVNINLAVFNLLPIPVLDGGQMLFATIGRLRGRALPISFVATTQSIFMMLLLSMVAYVTLFGDARRIWRESKANAPTREAPAQPADKSPGTPAAAKP
jgi:regulator of sigma E protease